MCEAVHSSIFAMEGDDDDDNLFNIDDDDEEMDREPTVADILAVDDTPVASAEPMAGTADGTGVAGVSSAPLEDPVMGEEEGDEEGGMGNDPYNEHEWDVLEGEMAEEAETRQDRPLALQMMSTSIAPHSLKYSVPTSNDFALGSNISGKLNELALGSGVEVNLYFFYVHTAMHTPGTRSRTRHDGGGCFPSSALGHNRFDRTACTNMDHPSQKSQG